MSIQMNELDPKTLRVMAHREMEIALLMGPSDTFEQAWADYCRAIVAVTDMYLNVVKK